MGSLLRSVHEAYAESYKRQRKAGSSKMWATLTALWVVVLVVVLTFVAVTVFIAILVGSVWFLLITPDGRELVRGIVHVVVVLVGLFRTWYRAWKWVIQRRHPKYEPQRETGTERLFWGALEIAGWALVMVWISENVQASLQGQ